MRLNLRRAASVAALSLGAVALSSGTALATAGTTPTVVVVASPSSVFVGHTTTLTTTLYNGNNVATIAPGTITLKVAGVAIPGCEALPVVNGTVSCQSEVFDRVDYKRIDAAYSGGTAVDAVVYSPANGYTWIASYGPATVTASVNHPTVAQRAPITYKADVVGAQLTSVGDEVRLADNPDYGTVAFFVDGAPVAGCATQPVSPQGVATCTTAAPAAVGAHTLKTDFSGVEYAGPNTSTAPFTVTGPVVTVSDADFGTVTVGETATRTVKVTNDGNAPLTIDTLQLGDGPFTYDMTATTCGGTVAPGASCNVALIYTPTAAGTHNGTLTLNHNAGVTTVALAGKAVAVAAPVSTPVAPVSTPAPPKGATIAPGEKTSFSVTVPTGTKAGAAAAPQLSLPLTCPADQECKLDGKLTIDTSTLVHGAHASAVSTTVAKFSGVQVKAHGLKTVKLEISPAFIKQAQKKGIRRIKATLTINSVFGSGQKVTTRQQVVIVIPKAAKKVVKKVSQVKPSFTG